MYARQTDKLTLYEPVTVVDKYGSESVAWTARGSIRAERVKRSGALHDEVGERFAARSTEWNVYYHLSKRLSEHWRVADVRDGGTLYEVTSITPNRDKNMAVLTCERVNE